jgi:hypothetical protein
MTDLTRPITGVQDVWCRLKSPDRQKVGLLIRSSDFNFENDHEDAGGIKQFLESRKMP